MVEQQLIERCKKGDREAQRLLYEQFSGALYGCCLKYAPNQQEAQDILQDSFITIYAKISQFKNKGSFEGWCKRITINTALQRYRGTQVHFLKNEEHIIDQSDDVDTLEDVAMDEMLVMIQSLPHQYRMVFSLYVLDGQSHKEIAGLMNINTNTSKSNLSRARFKLQQMIQEWRINNKCDAS